MKTNIIAIIIGTLAIGCSHSSDIYNPPNPNATPSYPPMNNAPVYVSSNPAPVYDIYEMPVKNNTPQRKKFTYESLEHFELAFFNSCVQALEKLPPRDAVNDCVCASVKSKNKLIAAHMEYEDEIFDHFKEIELTEEEIKECKLQ